MMNTAGKWNHWNEVSSCEEAWMEAKARRKKVWSFDSKAILVIFSLILTLLMFGAIAGCSCNSKSDFVSATVCTYEEK